MELVDLMQRARGFVFAAEEDFGIAMVEAQACGTPVIAYGKGGACDIVVPPEADHPTGLFFPRQDADAISSALARFDLLAPAMTSEACRANALRFSQERFRSTFINFVQTVSELDPAYVAEAA
jgi:glycosyltransferase involved in cell wall biosynthesis